MRTWMLAVAAIGFATVTARTAATVSARTTFRDYCATDACGSGADRIRSDSTAIGVVRPYDDGLECVKSQVAGTDLFLRTATYGCTQGYTRALTVDFSDPVALAAGVDCSTPIADAYGDSQTLDPCGSNLIPDARFIASGLFARASATGTSVECVLNLFPDFRHNEFELVFEQNLPITVLSSTSRAATGSAGSIADLYRISGSNKKTLIGQYRMPFQAVVQE